MHSEDQFDRAGEIERVVEVAGRAMAVIANRPERVLDLARDPADRTEQVPEQHEQALTRTVKAGRDDLIRVQAQSLGQGQRPDPGDLRIGSLARNSPSRSTTTGSTPRSDQPVQRLVEPRIARVRKRGRLLERIDARRGDPACRSRPRRFADRLARAPGGRSRPSSTVGQQSSAQSSGQDPDLVDQPGSAAAPRLELDQAEEPVEDALLELAQDAEPPALDPLERMFPPGERDDLRNAA